MKRTVLKTAGVILAYVLTILFLPLRISVMSACPLALLLLTGLMAHIYGSSAEAGDLWGLNYSTADSSEALTEEDGRILYETMYEVLPYTIWFQIPLLLFGADWVKAAGSVLVFLTGVAAGALAGKRKVYRHWQERKQ